MTEQLDITQFMPYAQHLGLKVTEATPDRIEGTVTVTKQLCTTGHIMHGGAVMSFADTLGAVGAFLNLPEGAKATTTIESKTNFLGAAPEGSVVTGVCEPVQEEWRDGQEDVRSVDMYCTCYI